VEVLNERQESEVGGNRENNKKWTERKKPAGRNRRMSEKREEGEGRDVSLVRRKLLAGEYTAD